MEQKILSREEILEMINELGEVNNATITYGNGVVNFTHDGDAAGILIRYEGYFNGISRDMPNYTQCMIYDDKILFKKLNFKNFSNELFLYNGDFRIKSCVIIDYSGKHTTASVTHDSTKNLWATGTGSLSEWDNDTTFWGDDDLERGVDVIGEIKSEYGEKIDLDIWVGQRVGKVSRKKSKIVIGNQQSDGKIYCDSKGTPYIGPFNVSSDLESNTNNFPYNHNDEEKFKFELLYKKKRNMLGVFRANKEGAALYRRSLKPKKLTDRIVRAVIADGNFKSKVAAFKKGSKSKSKGFKPKNKSSDYSPNPLKGGGSGEAGGDNVDSGGRY